MADRSAQNTSLARGGQGQRGGQSQSGAMARWSPGDDFMTLRRQMDDLFARAFGFTPLSQLIPGDIAALEPDVDVYETEDQVTVYASLPGYSPNDIDVQATRDMVTIHAERQALHEDDQAARRGQGRASGYSRFDATVMLPAEIDPNNVRASYQNGVLRLDMPKTEQARTRSVRVNLPGQQPNQTAQIGQTSQSGQAGQPGESAQAGRSGQSPSERSLQPAQAERQGQSEQGERSGQPEQRSQ